MACQLIIEKAIFNGGENNVSQWHRNGNQLAASSACHRGGVISAEKRGISVAKMAACIWRSMK
jgi:hypothetical protein